MTQEEIHETALRSLDNKGLDMHEANAYMYGFLSGSNYSINIQWIDVNDKTTEMGIEVLLSGRIGIVIGFDHEGKYYDFEMSEIKEVTHWMPLPEAPKQDNTPILNLP